VPASTEFVAVPPALRRRRRWVIAAVVVVLAAGTVVVVRDVFGGTTADGGSGDNASATSVVTIEQRTLSKQMQVNGVLGYTGSYTVLGQAHGTLTWLPTVGQVVSQGEALYQVDGAPVALLYGAAPAWRVLASGTTGADVSQLNHDLVALGYVSSADVSAAWGTFGRATRVGVKKLQKHLGVDQSGELTLGEVVFLPTAARVTALQAGLGAPATGPLLQASSTAPTVTVALAADQQSVVKVGDQVTLTLPNGSTAAGTVASVGTVATVASDPQGGNGNGNGDSRPTVPVTIQPTDPHAISGLDQAPVLVSITTTTVQNALAVPVYALLALAGGGFAVEVVNPDGARRLVGVTPGLFDDTSGLVQVTGGDLAAGQRIVVPAS
jgi:Putative peptidoglycan binding domain